MMTSLFLEGPKDTDMYVRAQVADAPAVLVNMPEDMVAPEQGSGTVTNAAKDEEELAL